MNEVQMSLFLESAPPVEAALTKFNGNIFAAPNQEHYIRHTGTAMLSAKPGTVILAAAPSHDGILPLLNRFHDEARDHGSGNGSAAICWITVPAASSARALQRKLLDSYQEATRLQASRRVCAPQTELLFDWAQLSRDPIRVVTGLVSQRPFDFYVVRRASDLVRCGSQFSESIEHIRYIIRMAEMMQRTHVIVACPAQVNRWLRSVEIAESTELCLMKPYDLTVPGEKKVFLSLLHSFDKLIPWQAGDGLLDHADEINQHVWGCPTRLHGWVRRALMAAKAKGMAHLTWPHVLEHRPIKTISDAAKADFEAAQALCGPKAGVPATSGGQTIPKAHYKPVKPGQRKPHRDDVGFDAA